MSTTTDHPIPTANALDAEIDRLALAIVVEADLAANVDRAAILDTLIRYRADREDRERIARVLGKVSP